MQIDHNIIKHIIELTLGQKISKNNITDFLQIEVDNSSNPLAMLKHYLINPHEITNELIAELVTLHIKRLPINAKILPKINTWDEYISLLDKTLAEVIYRANNNYELTQIMPTQAELYYLQQECLRLTEKHYGKNCGNISAFYDYFINMSQLGGITCFNYMEISKYVSADKYISQINSTQRREHYLAYDKRYKEFYATGGYRALGADIIDATAISNILYYKDFNLYTAHVAAKEIIVKELGLENFGQVSYNMRLELYHLLQKYYIKTTSDFENIFCRFVEFTNNKPYEYFNYFAKELPEALQVSPELLQNIVKVVGLKTNYLCMLPREISDNWLQKRHLAFSWQREYPLELIDEKGVHTVRPAKIKEHTRVLPNDLPYTIGHGLSLCGNGILDVDANDKIAFNWNNPVDPYADINNIPKDIEKLFREFKYFFPNVTNSLLKSEFLGNIFHNCVAYSTIPTTQHTHIATIPIEKYPIYMLQATKTYTWQNISATFEIVQVGHLEDAIYLRVRFNKLDQEELIQLLLKFNRELFIHFGGVHEIDAHIQLFATCARSYVFIYEIQAALIHVDFNSFENPRTGVVTPRRPQFLIPESYHFDNFTDDRAEGLEYVKNLFDQICVRGAAAFVEKFFNLRCSQQ